MILVTGGTGFLGAHVLCELLEHNYAVRALKRATSDVQEFQYIFNCRFSSLSNNEKAAKLSLLNWTPGDVLDVPSLEEAMNGVEKVYHIAALVSFSPDKTSDMMFINAKGTANVVNVARDFAVKKLCYCSSIAALGRTESGMTIDEKTTWTDSPHNTNYAISKYRAEMEVWRAGEEGLNVVMVNPGVILGEGNPRKGSCRMQAAAMNGVPIYTEGVNGYVDVRDVARAMHLLMESDISGERFVTVSENLSFKDFFTMAAQTRGKQPPRFKAPRWLMNTAVAAARVGSWINGTSPQLTRETARAMYNKFYYNSARIKERLHFSFTPIHETLKRVANTPPMPQRDH